MLVYLKTEALVQFLSVVLSLLLIVFFILKGKRTLLTYAYILCQCLIFIWSFGQMFEIYARNVEAEWAYVRFEQLPICFIGISWLIFSLIYTNNKLIKAPGKIIILTAIPFLNYLMVLTNEYHHLMYTVFEYKSRSYGPVFWISMLVNYSYLLGGSILLAVYSIKKMGYEKKQSLLLALAVTVPLLSNVIYISGLFRPGLDITPVSFAFSLLLFAVAIFKYKFLNLMPIAMKRIVDNVEEAIIVTDCFNTVIYVNDLFSVYFKEAQISKNGSINKFIEYIEGNADRPEELEKFLLALKPGGSSEGFDGEICFKSPGIRHFNIKIRTVSDSAGTTVGRVITFNDISKYINLLEQLNIKNEELLGANEQLKKYAEIREELAAVNERNRLAIDIHDTLGHTMVLLLKLQEACMVTCREDAGKTEEILNDAYKITKEGLMELRRSVSGLMPRKLEPGNLMKALKELLAGFESSGLEIELLIDGQLNFESPVYSEIIYRSCQEALTNSIRHGNAKKVNIVLRFLPERIKLFIIDDGAGCGKLSVGYGLSGMQERVKRAKGDIAFGSGGERGFNIHIEIPLESEKKHAYGSFD